MFFKRFFQKNKAKSVINFPVNDLNRAIDINRASLKMVDTWVDHNAMASSCFQYGAPDFIQADLDKEINREPTYSDYILGIGNKHFSKVKYLEIGVSVGKNFFQMMNGFENAEITGFDIEEIYPIVENKLILKNRIEWNTIAKSIKNNSSSLKRYSYKDKNINYVSADVWDENSWSKLKGNKYNLIFSDALHSAEAILFEFEMLYKYELLDKQFVIVWDDLVGDMQTAFFDIIKKYNKVYGIEEIYLVKVNGWVGQYEEKHSVGLISNFRMN